CVPQTGLRDDLFETPLLEFILLGPQDVPRLPSRREGLPAMPRRRPGANATSSRRDLVRSALGLSLGLPASRALLSAAPGRAAEDAPARGPTRAPGQPALLHRRVGPGGLPH